MINKQETNQMVKQIQKEWQIFRAFDRRKRRAWIKNIKIFAPSIYKSLIARERFDGIRIIKKNKQKRAKT